MVEKHIFALFYKDLSLNLSNKNNNFIEISDKDLAHRIFKVLRLQPCETVTLFDKSINLNLEISTSKNKLEGKILSIENNNQIYPEVTLMPCLLKRDAFEDIIYSAAQMAVTRVIPVISTKIQRNWIQNKELERLNNIMIAACEQSKSFAIPELLNPIKIEDLTQTLKTYQTNINAYFDPSGQRFLKLLQEIDTKPKTNIALLFGPEGGLTIEEEKIATNAGFQSYALTPTILRSREAIIVGLGGIRSIAK